MSSSSIPEPSPNCQIDQSTSETLETVEQQQINLKLELEQVYRDVSRLRGWIQLLVSGLILGMLISVIISSWLTYRLLLQQEKARREAAEAATAQTELLERIATLEQQLQGFTENTRQLTSLQDEGQIRQEEIQRLRDRLNQVEAVQRDNQTTISQPNPQVEKPSKLTTDLE